MKSPAKQKIIQIEVTNICPHKCSNCTRACGHHSDPFIMPFPTFRQAVQSLVDFPGQVGFMGGEPTMIPEFEKYVEYYASKIHPKKRRGLWTSLGRHYYKHMELIKDVFGYECINDHMNPGMHQPMLVASEELPIPEKEKARLIDRCWVQNLWSSSVTMRGCYFCECAATLATLLDGPDGWPIEPGWWKRQPKDFGYQLELCKLCGCAMPLPRRRANEGVDDVSPGMLKRLKAVDSPKASKCRVFDVSSYKMEDYKDWNPRSQWYLPKGQKRTSDMNSTIRPKHIDCVVTCVGYADCLGISLPHNKRFLDRVAVVTSPDDKDTQTVCRENGIEPVVTSRFFDGGAAFNKGKGINDGLAALDLNDWVLIMDADILLPPDAGQRIKSRILNPGCLHYTSRLCPKEADVGLYLANPEVVKAWKPPKGKRFNNASGYFQLWTTRARSLKGRSTWYSEDFPSAGDVDLEFMRLWPQDKQVKLDDFFVVHIPHGPHKRNWRGRVTDKINIPLPASDEPEQNANWSVVFRGDSPGIWGQNFGEPDSGRYARELPDYIKYLRIRMAPNPPIIFYFDGDPKKQKTLGSGFVWIPSNAYSHKAYHLGVIQAGFGVKAMKQHKGRVIIQRGRSVMEYSGWGFGHVMYEDNRQGFCWDGEPVEPGSIEIAVTNEELHAWERDRFLKNR